MLTKNAKVLFLLLSIIFLITFNSIASGDFKQVSENQEMILYLNPETTEIAVEKKVSGKIWYSNPQNRKSIEKIAKGSRKERLNSQIRISYYTPRNERKYMNNYSDCINYQQFEINQIKNGVKIDYLLGNEWDDEDYLPVIVGENNFKEDILNKVNKEKREFIKDLYSYLKLVKKPKDYEYIDIYGIEMEKLFDGYIFSKAIALEGRSEREFIEDALERIVENRSDYEEISEVTHEDIAQLIKNPAYILKTGIMAWNLDDYINILKNINFSPEMNKNFHKKNNIDPPYRNIELFEISLEYVLGEESLQVIIPQDSIIYPKEVINPEMNDMEVSYPLYTLELLEFFGAAPQGVNGYMLVPDGSGALIEFNEDNNLNQYKNSIYGLDYARRPRDSLSKNSEIQQLPVFGLKKPEKSWFAIIEDGDSMGNVVANVAGRLFSFSNIHTRFNIIPKAELTLSGVEQKNEYINLYQSRKVNGDIRMKYYFLDDKDTNYVDMAHIYQKYLVNKYGIEKLEVKDNIPFYLEIIGSIHKTEPVLGIPQRVVKSMSTYKETKMILEELNENGIENIKLIYNGWLEGGIHHNYPSGVKFEKSVGQKKDLKNLKEYLINNDFGFYPEISFVKVYNNKLFDGFNPRNDAARYLNRNIVSFSNYDIATNIEEKSSIYYLLSPNSLEELINNFIMEYKKMNIKGLAIRNMANILYSDFRTAPDKLVDREQAANIISEQLDTLKNKNNFNLLIRGANSYALPFAKEVLELPLYASGYNNTSKSIPFIQIVLSGYINYSGEPFNLSVLRENILKAVETGSLPYYRGIYKPSSELKGSEFDRNYAINYHDWLDNAKNIYKRFNEIYSEIYPSRIIDHKQLKEQVFLTEYETGNKIIVNYGDEKFNFKGKTVNSKDFLLIVQEGEKNE